MTFLYPLGLLGLIGVPILILIYILKNRYTEQTVASTYLWRLSERFLKRRNPLSRITGIISLILQILFVISISLTLAQPKIILKGAANEYCFVLDGSASMSMEKDGKTRLDSAKSEVEKIVDSAKAGSVFSLVYVTDITETVFELEDDRELIKERLSALTCSGSAIDYTGSLGVAQKLFNDNPSVLTYLLTDESYADGNHENVTVINVAKGETNISLYDVAYKANGQNSYTVTGKIISYGEDRATAIEVKNNLEARVLASVPLELKSGVEADFSLTFESEEFYSLTVTSTSEDAMASDNSVRVYNIKSENSYNVLLVSDTHFLIKSAIDAVSNANITLMTTEDYKSAEIGDLSSGTPITGYGLYIFDSVSPTALPSDGTIWFLGLTENVAGAGFSIQESIELKEGAEMELNKSSSTFMRRLTGGLSGESLYIKKYTKCGVYGNFNTIFSYMGNPLVFTGTSDSGCRTVAFSFNLHDTNFSLSPDFPILFNNLLSYSFPDVIEKTEYSCGEKAQINVIPGCTGIRVTEPSGSSFYADTASAVSEFTLSEVGEHKITLETAGGEREFFIFSSVPAEERCPTTDGSGIYSIRGEAENNGRDGEYNPLTVIFILAAIFFTAEWMVYCYDKYQLR